jgi:hypothetical protein
MFFHRHLPKASVIAPKTRLLSAPSRLRQRQPQYRPLSSHQVNLNSRKPPSRHNMSTESVETVDFTFVEEPLGLRADQGYGYLQVDFGQRIGPSDRYEILRKLGWGMNVRRALSYQHANFLTAFMQASVWLARDHEYVPFPHQNDVSSLHPKG